MDHDQQVTDLVQTTRDRFLNQPLNPDDRERDAFDLDAEFAKSAKNRSLVIPLAVFCFLLILGTGAYVASLFTDSASRQASVSIGSFEDLKLKEIFDTARKNKADLEVVQTQIDEATHASEVKVTAIQQAGKSKADIAAVQDPAGAQAILADTARQVAAEKVALAKTLAPLKDQAAQVQKKIDSYDSRIGDLNKKNQQVLDSQQRLFDLEKQKLTNDYEARLQAAADDKSATVAQLTKQRDDLVAALKAKQADDIRKLILKYNPVISDPILAGQLAKDGTTPADYGPVVFPDRIASHNLVPADLQNDFASRVDRTRQLLAKLRSIPYENSVPPLLNTLDKAIAASLVGFQGYLTPLAAHMTDLDGVIAAREATIADRDATIVALQATIAAREASIAGLQGDLANEKAGRQGDNQAAADAMTAEKADRSAENARNAAWLGRWTGSVDDYVASLRDHDGVFTDVRVADDWIVVLKPDRAKALADAIPANADAYAKAKATAEAAKKTVPEFKPVNLAVVRDGVSNDERATVSIEPVDGGWRAKLVKLNDPKRPIKAFDRIVLQLPQKK
ncbi:MAG TPA: hypothetical protein VMB23_01230 [Spirochaetia bacterium]|nr:hypothetical protein [Spirochaetia bacterium]